MVATWTWRMALADEGDSMLEEAEDSGGKEEVADGMEASAGCGWGLLTGAVAGTGAGMGCICASSSYCCEVRSTASMSASLSKESF